MEDKLEVKDTGLEELQNEAQEKENRIKETETECDRTKDEL